MSRSTKSPVKYVVRTSPRHLVRLTSQGTARGSRKCLTITSVSEWATKWSLLTRAEEVRDLARANGLPNATVERVDG